MDLTWSTQRAFSSFLSNDLAPGWKYDVFLSFTGVDTRKGFVSHLYHELCKCQGITTFYDERELERGTSISPELLSAIKASHTAIVVLSPKYAHSKWCLDELTNIVQCMEARKSILPVFYETNPSDVGNQRASFAEAFAEHAKLTSAEDKKKVAQWGSDLKKVSKICGWHLENFKSERQLIDDIVSCVWSKVQATFTLLDSSQKLVGTDSALEQLSLLLAHDANDVRFIGITGMGGVGKTTLAKLIYDKIFRHFEVHCFLENVREVSETEPTLVRLQKRLLSRILKENIENVSDQQWGVIYTKKCLCNKKVLLVLDDVYQINQIQVLAGKKDWFGMGSRIIITTRNQRLLVEHDITLCHNVEVLNDAEALELFSLHAFRKDQPEEDFLELSKHFLDYARGLPLVLETLGSSLYKKDQDAWNSVRDNLRKIPNPKVFDSLKVSFDGLGKEEKRIFLDVACHHKGKPTTEVLRMLDNSFGISSSSIIDVLIARFLVYNDYGNIGMHDLIQDMAWTIVRGESEDPGLRSRLWLFDDIFQILTTKTRSSAVESISLRLPKVEEIHQWNCEAFSKMHGLRFLEFDNLIFSSGPKFLPCSLRIINWSFYPSKFLPTSFHPRGLIELKMRDSNLVRLWEGKVDLPKLKYLDLSYSNKLINTPEFSGFPNLERLDLALCKNLVEIHPSIAFHKSLKFLSLTGSVSIKSLPSTLEMDSLESLWLVGCSNVKKIPEFGEQMKNVFEIHVEGTVIEKIPSSIGHLVGLERLYLNGCKNLLNLPRTICNLKSLRLINVMGCSKLDKLPGDMDHLETLECGDTMTEPLVGMKNLKQLVFNCEPDAKAREGWGLLRLLGLGKSRPDPPCWGLVLSSLNRLCSLRWLSLRDCQLCGGDIPDVIGCLSFLGTLDLSGNNFVSLPDGIKRLSKLHYLKLERCKSLQELPPLPSNSELDVNVDNCTSLKRLTDASKLSSRFTNLYDFWFSCKNCIALVQDEAWINTILSRIPRFVTHREVPDEIFSRRAGAPHAEWPGSEIPKWFSNQSVGNSINVKLPPTDWLGIAFCLVFQDPKQNLANPPPPSHHVLIWIMLSLVCLLGFEIGSFMSEHLLVFYWPRKLCRQEQFLFTTYLQYIEVPKQYADFNSVKKCGARLVYQQVLEELNQPLKILKRIQNGDEEASRARLVYKQVLEELNQPLKILKRTHEYGDEEASSGPVSASFNSVKKCGARLVYKQDLEELNQTLKILKRTHEYGDEEASSGPVSASFNDTEQNHKRHCY